MISMLSEMQETNFHMLHRFTICTDLVAQNKSEKPKISINFIDDIIKDKKYRACSIEERFNTIITYALFDMIGSINEGEYTKENWTILILDKPQIYLNRFNNTLEWIYRLQSELLKYVTFENAMRKGKWEEYAYYIRRKYKCYNYRLVASDMFSECVNTFDQIQKWPIEWLIAFILNNGSYYYQEDSTNLDHEFIYLMDHIMSL